MSLYSTKGRKNRQRLTCNNVHSCTPYTFAISNACKSIAEKEDCAEGLKPSAPN